MDFSKAAMLIGAVYAATEWAKSNINFPERLAGIVALVIAEATVFLFAATVWADTQVIGEVTLDKLDVPSKILAGFLVATGATVLHQGFKSVRNVGENQPEDPNP